MADPRTGSSARSPAGSSSGSSARSPAGSSSGSSAESSSGSSPGPNGGHHTLCAEGLTLAYDKVVVATDLSVAIPAGRITTIVGANACGKSTLLRALARLLRPRAGRVLIDGESIHRLPTKVVASRLGILPQSPIAPEGITVADLVGRGPLPPPEVVPAVVERG